MFAAGMCDMRETKAVQQLFEELPEDRKVIFHLNDSLSSYRSKKDSHAIIGNGQIWDLDRPETFESLDEFMRLCKITERDFVLETPSPNLAEVVYFEGVE
jgi:endonuclease IV